MSPGTYKWQKRFYEMAQLISTWSKDPECQVGAVIVTHDCRYMSMGYNGFPRGFGDTRKRLNDEEQRLAYTVHAELNAIYNGRFDLNGCSLYSTKFPCHECAKGIIQAGITRVISPPPTDYSKRDSKTWEKSQELANRMMLESGVQIIYVSRKDEKNGIGKHILDLAAARVERLTGV